MNSIISIITAIIITVSNLFGFAPVTEFFENLFSVEIFGEENKYTEELPEEPSEEDAETEENFDSENGNLNLNGPETQPEPVSDVKLVPAEGSTTIIDETTKAITGLNLFITEKELKEDFLAVEGDGYYELEYTNSDSKDWPGTGTRVKVYDNSNAAEPVAVYTIVIYGDINGDTIPDANDSTFASDEAVFITNWSRTEIYDEVTNAIIPNSEYNFYKTMAADLNNDGVVDATDALLIGDVAIGIRTIDQNTGETRKIG